MSASVHSSKYYCTAYVDVVLSKTIVYEWFARSKNGEMSSEPCSGHPLISRSGEKVDKINFFVCEDRRRRPDQLCEISGMS